jgi:hypothetical protein
MMEKSGGMKRFKEWHVAKRWNKMLMWQNFNTSEFLCHIDGIFI